MELEGNFEPIEKQVFLYIRKDLITRKNVFVVKINSNEFYEYFMKRGLFFDKVDYQKVTKKYVENLTTSINYYILSNDDKTDLKCITEFIKNKYYILFNKINFEEHYNLNQIKESILW